LKTLFHVQATQEPVDAQTLLLEIGPDHCSYAFFDRANSSISALKYFIVNEFETEASIQSISEEIKSRSFTEVIICSAFPNALLTPNVFARDAGSLVDIIYDQPMQHYLQDSINEWQLVNAYSLPLNVFELLINEFPAALFTHVYTPALKLHNGFSEQDQISIHFTTQYFRVLVKKQGQIELAQIYSYKTPLDVVYYLLKICSELQLDQSIVYLVLSGLVEEASALYKELHHYFLNIYFAQPPAVTAPENEYPRHFFSSVYNLAACVS